MSGMSDANNGHTLLRLEDLRVTIKRRKDSVTPLDGVDLSIGAGETVGLVGESGSGKTMTALALMGLLPGQGQVTGGRMLFNGVDLTKASPDDVRALRGTKIGMIFQDPMTSLNPTMKIGEQIGEPLIVHQKASKADARAAAIDIMSRVGMPRPERIADDYPHQLSGGMRQRAMIAMALVCRPQLLIADEPTTALDVTTQRQILDLIDDLKHEFGTAVLLVTHDLGVVAGRADRVAVMYAGRIAETAPARELFADPRHQYTRSLLAALPERAAHSRERLYSIPGSPPDLTEPLVGCPFAPRCPRADEACLQRPELGGGVHQVACFHPGGEAFSGGTVAASGETAVELGGDRIVLSLAGVDKEYDALGGKFVRRRIGTVSAVHDVSFRVRAGETLGVVGESGCGKSTLGRVIAGLEPQTKGELVVDGIEVDRLDGRGRRDMYRSVQMMFQDSAAAMDPRMRVDEILTEPIDIQKTVPARERAALVADLVDKVGLPENAMDRYPHEFSGGQLQRIGLARSMALSPQLIVCDEPVSALDVSVQAQVLNLLRDLQQEHGLAYVFISHDLAVVRYMSDRIAVMYLGELVELGPADSVVENPLHPYSQALLDAIPTIEEKASTRPEVIAAGQLPSAMDPPSGCRFRTRCPFAQEICATTPPVARRGEAVGEFDDHWALCHFPMGSTR